MKRPTMLKDILNANYLNKIREKGILWAALRLLCFFMDILCLPFWYIQKIQAIRTATFASIQSRDTNHAVFVCDQLHLRVIKIAYALKKIGWKVTLLHKDSFSFDVSEYFCDIHQFKNPWEALLIASGYYPIVYHVFSMWNFEVASIFIRYKPGKIVFDNYDVLTGMVKDAKCGHGNTELEQYCYAKADGLCCRDLRVQYLKNKLGYNFPPRLLFPEYCWPESKFNKLPKLMDSIHIVYIGSIETNPESPVAYLYDLAAILSKNKIHLHVYSSQDHIAIKLKNNMNRFVESDADKKYVHIHGTISPLDITREISKYHYGLLISQKNVDFDNNNETSFQHVGDYFLAAKIFDYLDAGLCILIQNAKFIRFILERYNKGKVVSSLEDIAQHCKNKPSCDITIPKSLLLESNANRLAEFYLNLR